MLRSLASGAAVAAALSLAMPAAAQDDRHERRGTSWRSIVGALVLGSLFGVPTSADTGVEDGISVEIDPDGYHAPPGEAPPGSPEQIAEARCGDAVEAAAQRYAGSAEVVSITSYVALGKRVIIKGKVDLAQGFSDAVKPQHKFRCELRRGSAPDVRIDGLSPA
ncbi:hypothetical protein FHS95_001132 [Sphingomonas naasensis]|uniref:Uncharacterized protein n=1 Tax=Sphingomonas naasensis TaxID=1344951 RepID=A0A4S1WCN9_9SPHN|nr:hypothetical protein [Sphingomonas naasensis]NIJ19463.1 hypothetical protein [Sphingomonas naasensis]TGX39200.1 hypothetical protein E5A74_16925 [Sphingomonas naasensis]